MVLLSYVFLVEPFENIMVGRSSNAFVGDKVFGRHSLVKKLGLECSIQENTLSDQCF